MLYLVHEQGRITQANKVYAGADLAEYEQRMRAEGLAFVKRDVAGLIDTEQFHIASDGRLISRRPMQVGGAARRQLLADGKDQIVLRGLRKPARVIMSAGPFVMFDESISDGSVALTTDTPGVFTVRIEAFPFLPWSADFEAVA